MADTQPTDMDSEHSAPGDAGQRVLIVDDEPSIVDVLCMLLEDEGFVVTGVTDPRTAVTAIRRDHPDLLLTDVMMPGMSGYELARLAITIEPRIQIVFMSAVVEPGAAQEHPFLAKPFDLGQVIDLVDTQLRVS